MRLDTPSNLLTAHRISPPSYSHSQWPNTFGNALGNGIVSKLRETPAEKNGILRRPGERPEYDFGTSGGYDFTTGQAPDSTLGSLVANEYDFRDRAAAIEQNLSNEVQAGLDVSAQRNLDEVASSFSAFNPLLTQVTGGRVQTDTDGLTYLQRVAMTLGSDPLSIRFADGAGIDMNQNVRAMRIGGLSAPNGIDNSSVDYGEPLFGMTSIGGTAAVKPLYNEINKQFLEQQRVSNPLEVAKFEEFTRSIDTSNWPQGEVRETYFEVAYRKFDAYARQTAFDPINAQLGISGSVGPEAIRGDVLDEIGKALGTGAQIAMKGVNSVLDAYGFYDSVKNIGDMQSTFDATVLRENGPQVFNERLFKQVFHRPYNDSLNQFVPPGARVGRQPNQ